MDISKGPYQPWYLFLFTFAFWIVSLTLGYDIATDHLNSFGSSPASWYYLIWEVGEIITVASFAGWFMYRTNSKSAVIGWAIFTIVGLTSAHGLLFTEVAASGLVFKRGVQLGIGILALLVILDSRELTTLANDSNHNQPPRGKDQGGEGLHVTTGLR